MRFSPCRLLLARCAPVTPAQEDMPLPSQPRAWRNRSDPAQPNKERGMRAHAGAGARSSGRKARAANYAGGSGTMRLAGEIKRAVLGPRSGEPSTSVPRGSIARLTRLHQTAPDRPSGRCAQAPNAVLDDALGVGTLAGSSGEASSVRTGRSEAG